MAFEQVYPIFAAGPRSELSLHYGRFTVSNSGATLTASSDTSQGLTITGAAGIYVLNHPKCRFRMVKFEVQIATIATVANARDCIQHVPVAATDDALSGVLNFNTTDYDASAVVTAPVDGSVIEVFAVLGF